MILWLALIFAPHLWASAETREPIQPLPVVQGLDARKVELGKRLFNDKRLSGDNSVACANCHRMNLGGGDGLRVSVGANAALGEVNSPSVFNSALNFRQFWDGRARNLFDQADIPLTNPKEMASNWNDVVKKISADPFYRQKFQDLGVEISAVAIKEAIVEFEKALVTLNAPFDRYLKGDMAALRPQQIDGYQKFKSYGCIACHQGVNVGGNMFQTMGVMGNYFLDRGHPTKADLGLFNSTGRPEDKHVFKVPSLRNVALTAPYFHDGSAKNLPQAVRTMAKYQLGQELPEADVNAIVKFLESLTGELPPVAKE